MSDRTRCWFGAVTGHTVPMARMAVAGMRATRLSDEDIGAEYFLDRHAEPDTGLVADVCKAMATALRSLGKEYGDTIPILPEAIWIEAMGYDDRPDGDDCIIAVDLGTGDFCYDRILTENPQSRAGAVICLDKISEFIRTRTFVDGMGQ